MALAMQHAAAFTAGVRSSGTVQRRFGLYALRPKPNALLGCNAVKDGTGFLDLANLVSGGGGAKTAYDELAGKIGKEVYVDINGWHLYLRDISVPGKDAKLSQALAALFGSKARDGMSEGDVEAALKQVPFKLGGGKTELSLFEVVPSYAVQELAHIVQEYARNK